MKKVYIPFHVRKIHFNIAKDYCEKKGYKFPKNFSSADIESLKVSNPRENPSIKALKAQMFKSLKEAYTTSYTPGGELKNNPGSPQLADQFFYSFDFYFGNDDAEGFFERVTGLSNDDPKLKDYLQRFRSSVTHLANLYLDIVANQQRTSKAYPKGANVTELFTVES
ncbi:MAG: hypothetical protein IT392_13650, partial [Nitrospirae bacterium]|nr:hypothetical protein [Nitrospirota bacterium]